MIVGSPIFLFVAVAAAVTLRALLNDKDLLTGEDPPVTVEGGGPGASSPATTSPPVLSTFEEYPAVLDELERQFGPNPEVAMVAINVSYIAFFLPDVDGSAFTVRTWLRDTRSFQDAEMSVELPDVYGRFRVRDANPSAPSDLVRLIATEDPNLSVVLFDLAGSGLSWRVYADGTELIANADGTVRHG